MAGPLAAMLLTDFGADVVKVIGPDDDPDRREPGWPVWNRGKRAIRLDRSDARLQKLVGQADVCVVSETLLQLRGGPPRSGFGPGPQPPPRVCPYAPP